MARLVRKRRGRGWGGLRGLRGGKCQQDPGLFVSMEDFLPRGPAASSHTLQTSQLPLAFQGQLILEGLGVGLRGVQCPVATA